MALLDEIFCQKYNRVLFTIINEIYIKLSILLMNILKYIQQRQITEHARYMKVTIFKRNTIYIFNKIVLFLLCPRQYLTSRRNLINICWMHNDNSKYLLSLSECHVSALREFSKMFSKILPLCLLFYEWGNCGLQQLKNLSNVI